MNKLRVLDLFSGIGGFSLGLERTGGFKTVAFCEIDPFCRAVLKKHWPDVPIYGDIRELNRQKLEEVGILDKRRKPEYEIAVEMYLNGMSIEQIANYFNVTRQSMWKSLRRRLPQLRSNLRYGENNHFYRGGIMASDRSQNLLEQAIEDGLIKRKDTCEICGKTSVKSNGKSGIEAHHCDYNKPYDVIWLCKKCHYEWHKNNVAIPWKEVVPNECQPQNRTIDVICGGPP